MPRILVVLSLIASVPLAAIHYLIPCWGRLMADAAARVAALRRLPDLDALIITNAAELFRAVGPVYGTRLLAITQQNCTEQHSGLILLEISGKWVQTLIRLACPCGAA